MRSTNFCGGKKLFRIQKSQNRWGYIFQDAVHQDHHDTNYADSVGDPKTWASFGTNDLALKQHCPLSIHDPMGIENELFYAGARYLVNPYHLVTLKLDTSISKPHGLDAHCDLWQVSLSCPRGCLPSTTGCSKIDENQEMCFRTFRQQWQSSVSLDQTCGALPWESDRWATWRMSSHLVTSSQRLFRGNPSR